MPDFRRRSDRTRTKHALTLLRGLVRLPFYLGAALVGVGAVVIGLGNILFSSDRGIPYRALDPLSAPCRETARDGWDILARKSEGTPTGSVGNDEWAAIDLEGEPARRRLTCAIQHHAIPGYKAADGSERTLRYDLAFIEFQEGGKPYALRVPCPGEDDHSDPGDASGCRDDGRYGRARKSDRSQLQGVLDALTNPAAGDPTRPHYVLVFVHGWRHNAEIGDANVGDFRHYAAHAARFLEDRFPADASAKPRVTAIYLGWRGARTDETWLKRRFDRIGARLDETVDALWGRSGDQTRARPLFNWAGEWIGTISALPTLFDRKPVSETIAPAAIGALRAIEHRLGIDKRSEAPGALPPASPNKMIVFGHSLGGNLLATGLKDDLVKKVARHEPNTYMLPPIGNLVVLINPASEAEKWIDIQRAVWRQVAMSGGERSATDAYVAGHVFFPDTQRPILLSVTAARDWPPGGNTELDCSRKASVPGATVHALERKTRVEPYDPATGTEYDWATYDLFPAFKGDFRPLADLVERMSSGRDPHDQCVAHEPLTWWAQLFDWMSRTLRTLPFTQTNPEQTRTIGHLDPPRSPKFGEKRYLFPERPFGTTHELRGSDAKRFIKDASVREREVPVTYAETLAPVAACPVAGNWLGRARKAQRAADHDGHATRWSSDAVTDAAPALTFTHGFQNTELAAITRANDPFWNLRAYDTALARHDGYMLSSFICAMNQLVMDDITDFAPTPAVSATPRPAPTTTASPEPPPATTP